MGAHTPIEPADKTGSTILDRGKPPSEWVQILAGRGLDISERTLREKAHKLDAFHKLGRVMLITPAQMDIILGEKRCRSNPTEGARHGGRRAGSNISAGRSRNTTDAALEQLKQQALGRGAATKKSAA